MAVRRFLIPLMVGLLVAALLGSAGGPVAATEPRTVTAAIMIPGSAFLPMDDDQEYSVGISGVMGGATGVTTLFAPLWFPAPVVTIKRITLYAFDSSLTGDLYVWLHRAYPPGNTSLTPLGQLGTAGSIGYQTISTTAISPRRTNTANYALMLRADLRPNTRIHGVKILFSYDAGY